MSTIKVIGIGSPFGNDSLGWQVIDRLKQQNIQGTRWPEQIDLIEADRPGINLIQLLQDAEVVILVDAIHDEPRQGQVIRLDKTQLLNSQHNLSSHSLDVASALALAEKLQLLPKTIVVLGLGIDPGRAEPLNTTAIHKLTAVIVSELETYISQPSPS